MSTEGEKKTTSSRGDAAAKEWAHQRAGEFGEAVRFWRNKHQLTAVELSNRTREIGYPITRATLAKIETNSRNSKVDFAEVVTLAAALEVVPADLVFFGYPGRQIDVTPRTNIHANEAREWFVGGRGYRQWAEVTHPRIHLSEIHERTSRDYFEALEAFEERRGLTPSESGKYWIKDEKLAMDPNDILARARFDEELAILNDLRNQVIEAGGYVGRPDWWDNYDFVPF